MGKNMMKSLERRRKLAEARDEAKDLVLKVNEDFLTRVDVVVLYTLWKVFGFGAKRAERFYLNMVILQHAMIEEYRTDKNDDETHYLVMANRLKQAGIDVKALQEKAEQIKMPDCKYEERQKKIKELLSND